MRCQTFGYPQRPWPVFDVFYDLEDLLFGICSRSGMHGPNSKKCVVLRHIQLAVRNDGEVSKFLGTLPIANGRVMANINNLLWLKNGVTSSKLLMPAMVR
ncbi:hypothetical protein GIB67_004166 [Kingdonia uniflora]|uniref:Histone H2A n=1 Tax=Kingdonia uniflora TaxID=39325 RepID=A0A7J7M2D1_9MAGN|nr:hypothetical protein GIB67_004166 [Kingdonia uniflora]